MNVIVDACSVISERQFNNVGDAVSYAVWLSGDTHVETGGIGISVRNELLNQGIVPREFRIKKGQPYLGWYMPSSDKDHYSLRETCEMSRRCRYSHASHEVVRQHRFLSVLEMIRRIWFVSVQKAFRR